MRYLSSLSPPPEGLSSNQIDDLAAAERQIATFEEWLKQFPAHAPLVALTVYNAYDDLVESLLSLIATVADHVPLVAIDDNSPDERVSRLLGSISGAPNFHWFRKRWNSGVVDSCDLAFHLGGRRDIVILNSDIVLPAGWLGRLRRAAYSRSGIASATPLSNNALLYSVPFRNQAWDPKSLTVDDIDAKIQATTLEIFPPIPSAITFCTYIRRYALDLVGSYDHQFSPGYGEEVDWSQRALIHGLENVLADNLFVHHKGGGSFGTSPSRRAMQDAHEVIVDTLYPWHHANAVRASNEAESPLAHALAVASAAIVGLNIAVDATSMAAYITGTQIAIAHFVAHLEQTRPEGSRMTVIVSDGLAIEELDVLRGGLWAGIEVITRSMSVEEGGQSFDLVHRPCQVLDRDQVLWLHSLARRVVVSQLDCIAFNNPAYHADVNAWNTYRRAAEMAFEAADGIFFNSREVGSQCEAAGLQVPAERSLPLYNGVDHLTATRVESPAFAEQLADRPFILVLGANWIHKNRPFALRVHLELVVKLGWQGRMVFVGPQVSDGGTANAEASFLDLHPDLTDSVIDLDAVSESDKAWLLKEAALVLYPSTVEGFGFVPFEAAAYETPALTWAGTVFPEVLGPKVDMFAEFDATTVALQVRSMIEDPGVASAQVHAIRARAGAFNWDDVAKTAWRFYDHVHRLPKRYLGAPAPRSHGLTSEQRSRLTELTLIKSSRSYRLARALGMIAAPLKTAVGTARRNARRTPPVSH